MSDTISIALVAEGITDYEVLKAAVESMLDGRSFDMKLLQPEASVAFTGAGNAGALGGGWRGVYKWLLQAVERSGGQLRNDPLFHFYDILVIHLDADVAREDPANYRYSPIPELVGMLPCEVACLTGDPRPLKRPANCVKCCSPGWVKKRFHHEQLCVHLRNRRRHG
jgi:hypothetical protein